MKRTLIIVQGLLMAYTAFFIVSLIYTFFTGIFILITGLQEVNSQIDYCLMVMAVMTACLLFYLWYKKYMGHVEAAVDFIKIFSLKHIGIYLMIALGCQFFVSGILSLIRPLFANLFANYEETISSIFVADTVIVAVYVIILAPIIEELILRGILFNRLRYGLSFYSANLIQALVFGIYHWNIIQGLYAFGIGLILGYVYEKTRSLYVPILLHVFINGLGFLIRIFNFGTYISIWAAILIGAIFLFAGIFLFARNLGDLNNK